MTSKMNLNKKAYSRDNNLSLCVKWGKGSRDSAKKEKKKERQ